MPQRTFFMIKPDGVGRDLVGKIVKKVETSGFAFSAMQTLQMPIEQAEKLYAVHRGKPFYAGLVKFITSGPVVVSVVEGENVVTGIRDLMGATDPRQAAPGTIRGDYKEENLISPEGIMKNVVHGSDSPESAAYEIPIFFSA